MSEFMLALALATSFFMVLWWKFLRGGDFFSVETIFGMVGFTVGMIIAFSIFAIPEEPIELVLFVLFPVTLFIMLDSFMSMMTLTSSIRTVSLTNIEERTKKMQELGVEKMLKKLKAQPLHVSLRGNSLYVIDSLIPNYELKYLVYTDPSSPEKIYGCFVPSHFNTADEAMAWKFYITEEEYQEELKYEA